jgi:hypothetical protein
VGAESHQQRTLQSPDEPVHTSYDLQRQMPVFINAPSLPALHLSRTLQEGHRGHPCQGTPP